MNTKFSRICSISMVYARKLPPDAAELTDTTVRPNSTDFALSEAVVDDSTFSRNPTTRRAGCDSTAPANSGLQRRFHARWPVKIEEPVCHWK
jgi:hypothetical protein